MPSGSHRPIDPRPASARAEIISALSPALGRRGQNSPCALPEKNLAAGAQAPTGRDML